MYRITTDSGRVGHIAGNIVDTSDGRVVTTVCGKTHREAEFHTDDSLDPCAACDKKFYNIPDDVVDVFPTEKEAEKATAVLVKEAAKETNTPTSEKK
jgi:hypothetical protein